MVYKRTENGPLYLVEHMAKGHVSIPKGHVEGNETESETAIREIKEETNLDVVLDTRFKAETSYSPYENCIKKVTFFVAEAVSETLVNQECEVSALEWLPFEQAKDVMTFDSDKDVLTKADAYLKDLFASKNTGGEQMNEAVIKRNDLLAQKVIKGLETRNMSGYYASSKEEAKLKALELIGEGSTVTMGGSASVAEIGLLDAVKNGNYKFLDRDAASDKRKAMIEAYDADVFLSSVNAMTDDGVLVNIDGNANRVSAIAQGPKKVIFIVGMNKVCGSDVDGAMTRARNVAAPTNAQRFGLSTPCSKTGACMNCKSPDTICCQFLITRYSRHAGRIHVILVNDNLGF